jgi:undecaprenyl-diphosphatase
VVGKGQPAVFHGGQILMQPFEAIILGAVQGLTEFLPVSSSGHLVIFQYLFNLKEPEVLFNVGVHMGTLIAVIIFFRKDLHSIIASVFSFFNGILKKKVSFADATQDMDIKLALLIIVGTIPTGILGLFFHTIVDRIFSSVVLVGLMLIVTGSLLIITVWIKNNGKSIKRFSFKEALIIGLMQGISILPGISRSGSTIAVGLFMGLERETAARFSFLLSIPAIIGATILEFKDISTYPSAQIISMLIGAFTSCLVGYGALGSLLYIVKKGRLHFFAPYCFAAGVIALIIGL